MARKSAKAPSSPDAPPEAKTPKRAASKAKPKSKATATAKAKSKATEARPAPGNGGPSGRSSGDRREPEEGQVDQQVPGLGVRGQGQHGACPRPPQAQAQHRRRARLHPRLRDHGGEEGDRQRAQARGGQGGHGLPGDRPRPRGGGHRLAPPEGPRPHRRSGPPGRLPRDHRARRQGGVPATSARSTWTRSMPSRRGGSSTASSATSSARSSGARWPDTSAPAGSSRWPSGSSPSARRRSVRSSPRSTGGSPPRSAPRARRRSRTGSRPSWPSGKGAKFAARTEAEAHAIRDALATAPYAVRSVEEVEKLDKADAPFKTSTLQQQAAIRLRFSSKRTMKVAQELYEGIDVGGEGQIGLITYMRTDSLRVSDEAVKEVRDLIGTSYGERYLPAKPNRYAAGKQAQEAHEAIRPTDLKLTPESIRSRLTIDQFKLYQLIYRRFVASQMTPAVFAVTNVAISAAEGVFKTQGKILKFDGHRRVLPPGRQAGRPAPAPPGRGPGARPQGARAHAALHPAAAALLRGGPDQGAREGEHRPSEHLRADHPDDPGPPLRRAEGAAVLRDRPGDDRHRPPGRALPQDHGPEVHRAHGGRARRHRDRQGRHGQGARRVLPSVPGGAEARRRADGAGAGPVVGDLPRVRGPDDGEVQPDGVVPRLLEVSRVQVDPADGRPGPPGRDRDRASLPEVRQAADAPREQAGALPLVLGLSEVQGVLQPRRGGQPGPLGGRDRARLREVRQADGPPPGVARRLPRLHRLPQMPQHDPRRRQGPAGRGGQGRGQVREVRRADGGQARASRGRSSAA